MSYRYFLPRNASSILNEQQYEHLGLLLNKYIPKEAIEGEDKSGKSDWLREIASSYQPNTELIEASLARWKSYVSALHGQTFHATVNWRLIIGLGSNTVLETGLTLHSLYGLPIIPGSALKGLTRAYAATEDATMYLPNGKPSLKIETDPEDIQCIFGSEIEKKEHAGSVIFFDAIVMDKFSLTLDIMNPHYSNYYGKGDAPSNDQNPIPVPFLTISNATFQFAVAPRDYSKQKHRENANRAKAWLKLALQDYGVGSKTSADYGYFIIGEDINLDLEEKM
jgi:CRISPR-associated protein Cmr6